MTRARDVMTHPVRTVAADAPVREAGATLARYGHNGLPVLEGGDLVGMVSRRDVERALAHGFGEAPVHTVAVRPVLHADPGTSVDALAKLMVERNVGRIPIVDAGRLVGIVTRSDLLEARHRPVEPPTSADAVLARLSDEAWRAVSVLREALPEGGALYLVGGSVRDALLGAARLDLDLAVERASPDALAVSLQRELGGKRSEATGFGTASVRLPDGLTVDLAVTREERYPQPGALPEVVESDLRRDLARRDFTVNALACRLAPQPPVLLDPQGGLRDLREGVLRVLHPLSFVEDPTRIVRAARLAARLGFVLEPGTADRARAALRRGDADRVSAERLRAELELTVREPRPAEALAVLEELGALRSAYGLAHPAEVLQALDALRAEGRDVPPDAYLLALLEPLAPETQEATIARFRWPKRRSAILGRIAEMRAGATPTDRDLKTIGRAGRALLEAAGGTLRERVRTFENLGGRRRLRGQDVIGLGLPPGPDVGRVLEDVARARSERRVDGFEQELELARTLVRRILAGRERQDEAT